MEDEASAVEDQGATSGIARYLVAGLVLIVGGIAAVAAGIIAFFGGDDATQDCGPGQPGTVRPASEADPGAYTGALPEPGTPVQQAQPGVEAGAIPDSIYPIYVQAGQQYGVPWAALAGIGWEETHHGAMAETSSAGAQGFMQFMPGTWAIYGNGGDPDNPTDAIAAAARYLVASGAHTGQQGLKDALFTYNHATWYVNDVLTWANQYADNPSPTAPAANVQPAGRQTTCTTTVAARGQYLPIGPQAAGGDHLTAQTRALRDLIQQTYGSRIYSIGGWRASSESGAPDHPDGRALDVMVGTGGQAADATHDATAEEIVAWLQANKDYFYLEGLIYKQRYWDAETGQWSAMADRGSITANHYDHVHVVQQKNPAPPPAAALAASVSHGAALPLDRATVPNGLAGLQAPHHDTPAVDLAVPVGTPVYAVVGGTVERAGFGTGFGNNAVYIRDAAGYLWRYGHGSAHHVTEGQVIPAGTLIVSSGDEGESTGPHVHIDIQNPSGTLVCPQSFLTAVWNGAPPPPVTGLPSAGCTFRSSL